jgi:DNA-binding NtrC family response regulator
MEVAMERRSARILVVDDEDAIRLTVEMLLRRRGYSVTTASNGAEARVLIEQQPFDLLLLDLKMPGASGVEVARYALGCRPESKILILTGSTQIEGAAEEPGLDEFDYMLKTASPQEVLERVAAMIG